MVVVYLLFKGWSYYSNSPDTQKEKVVYVIAPSISVFIIFRMQHREMVKGTGSGIKQPKFLLLLTSF